MNQKERRFKEWMDNCDRVVINNRLVSYTNLSFLQRIVNRLNKFKLWIQLKTIHKDYL